MQRAAGHGHWRRRLALGRRPRALALHSRHLPAPPAPHLQATVEPDLEEEQPAAVLGRVPLAAVAANLEAVLPQADGSLLGESDIEEELLGDAPEGFSRSPRSFASLFTDDEAEEAAVVDPSLLLVNCGLSEGSVRALEERGITSLFPIQKTVFEPAMRGADLIARAKTGSGEHPRQQKAPRCACTLRANRLPCWCRAWAWRWRCMPGCPSHASLAPLALPAGKTLAFAIPIIEKIMAGPRNLRKPQCLVLAPTRELAKQVRRLCRPPVALA